MRNDFYAGLSRYLFEEKLAEFRLIAEDIPLDGSFNPEDIEFGMIKMMLTRFAPYLMRALKRV